VKYLQFTIENYRAITDPVLIDVGKTPLLPIIGVNESGKTTILHALFAFDFYNDKLNDGGRHLKDTVNLYRTGLQDQQATVTARISIEIDDLCQLMEDQGIESKALVRYRRKHVEFANIIHLQRNIVTGLYSILDLELPKAVEVDKLCRIIIGHLPYILFFDDFRDSFEERIPIVLGSNNLPSGWLAIINQLFVATDPNLSVFDLAEMEERQRKSAVSKVKRHLNKTLTREWQTFRLDDSDALTISIEYEPEKLGTAEPAPAYIKLDVIETDASGNEHFFFIRDRSKGFFWFFNFVMKLEFNPKIVQGNTDGTIYLLDEPGSYLHASAQSKLCNKLRMLAKTNKVIYCTHSHYLLNP